MQLKKDSDLFMRLVDARKVEPAFKDAIDQLTSEELKTHEQKLYLRSVIESSLLSLFQNAQDDLAPLFETLNELTELRNESDMPAVNKVKAFEYIIDQYKISNNKIC